jgi:hypothetical protein
MSRVEWAIARYNWYRACGLLDDLPQQTTDVATYQRSPDPPPPKPHLKWYPLSKPDDDIAATYQQPVATTQRHRYSQQADNARPQTIPTRDDAEKALNYDSSTWSRVEWAIARYNWYRACGLLDEFAPSTAETTRYQRSPDPPPPKPHLKWYPLSKSDDDTATTYQRSVTESPPVPQRRYCQRVEHARARAMLARYQSDRKKSPNGGGSGHAFDPSKHPRDEIGRFTENGGGGSTVAERASRLPPLSQRRTGKNSTGWAVEAAVRGDPHDVRYRASYMGTLHKRQTLQFDENYSVGELVTASRDGRQVECVKRNGKFLPYRLVQAIAAESEVLLDSQDWDAYFDFIGVDSTDRFLPPKQQEVPITLTAEWLRQHQLSEPVLPVQPAVANNDKPPELAGLDVISAGSGRWLLWDKQGNMVGEYANGEVQRHITDTEGRMTPGTYSLPLKDVKEVISWYWHSPDNTSEWDSWYVGHGHYVHHLDVPEISWDDLSAGSLPTAADEYLPQGMATAGVSPLVWQMTWTVIRGALEKYIGGKIASIVLNKGVEIIITRADGKIIMVPLTTVRDWARKLLPKKGNKVSSEAASEVVERSLNRIGIVPGSWQPRPIDKIPKVASSHPLLPLRKHKGHTTGIFNDHKIVTSGADGGEALEVFASRMSKLSEDAIVTLKHVEGHAAAEMVKNHLKEAVIHINYEIGPCRYCKQGVTELLGEGQKLWVVYPDGAGYFTNKGWFPK